MIDEICFLKWLKGKGFSSKVQSDTTSRLKRLIRAMEYIDINLEYKKDKCEKLLALFKNKGLNDSVKKYINFDLPVGTYQLATYKYALKLYIDFLKN